MSALYVDTSALLKLVVIETESAALKSLVAARPAKLATNTIGVVELQRVASRVGSATHAAAVRLLARIDKLELTRSVISTAATVPPSTLRTLDALHVASAAELADLEAVVTYDTRMAEAARGYGLPVISPR